MNANFIIIMHETTQYGLISLDLKKNSKNIVRTFFFARIWFPDKNNLFACLIETKAISASNLKLKLTEAELGNIFPLRVLKQ